MSGLSRILAEEFPGRMGKFLRTSVTFPGLCIQASFGPFSGDDFGCLSSNGPSALFFPGCCRVSCLKKAVDQKNQALTCLNQVMNVSAALLSSQNGQKPISCAITAHWSHILVRDTLTVSCVLENSSECSLERGWTFCVQLFAGSCDFGEGSSDSATTYTFPIDQLLPGNKTEVTLPLGPAEGAKLELPFTVSCSLYYSLQEILGTISESSELLDDLFSDDSPGLCPDREGICLPLKEATIDLLQCLRLDRAHGSGTSDVSPSAAAISLSGNPLETFLKLSQFQSDLSSIEGSDELVPGGALGEGFLIPSVASIKVSSDLLRTGLKDLRAGMCFCCVLGRELCLVSPPAPLPGEENPMFGTTVAFSTLALCRTWEVTVGERNSSKLLAGLHMPREASVFAYNQGCGGMATGSVLLWHQAESIVSLGSRQPSCLACWLSPSV